MTFKRSFPTLSLPVFVLVSIVLISSTVGCRPTASPSTIDLVFWDWQPSIPLPESLQPILSQPRVPFIVVFSGSISVRDGHPFLLRRIRSDTLYSYRNKDIHFCYRADEACLKKMGLADDPHFDDELVNMIKEDLKLNRASCPNLRGAQLDFDFPSRLITRYAEFLRPLSQSLHSDRFLLSATVTENWLWHLSFRKVLPSLDFYVPMFYGYDVPAQKWRLVPPLNPRRLPWCLRLANLWGKPYYAGLPCYTLSTVYNEKGHLVSMESDLSLEGIANHSAFRQLPPIEMVWNGVSRHRYMVCADAVTEDRRFRKGWEVYIDEITPALFQRLLVIVRETGGTPCHGVMVFRLEKHDEDNALSPEAILEMFEGSPERHDFAVRAEGLHRTPHGVSFRVSLSNLDPYPSKASPLAAKVIVRVRGGRLLLADPGQFYSAETGFGFETRFAPCFPQRANSLRLGLNRLGSFNYKTSGPIEIEKTDGTFAVYLYATLDSTRLDRRLVLHDFEILPEPVTPPSTTTEPL